MEMNIIVFLSLFICVEPAVVMQPYVYSRIRNVASSQNHSNYIISSNTGVKNQGNCAKLCKIEGCFSFSYNADENKCDTYSRYFEETDNEEDSDISITTLHFSRDYMYMRCSDITVGSPSGVYRIKILEYKAVNLYCDMDTALGPWTVIQRRMNGGVDFYRNWTDYKNGFGDLNGEFWIGNDNLHHLSATHIHLNVELESWNGTKGVANYVFWVTNEDYNYRLSVYSFYGNISDSLSCHAFQPFSTPDRDNDDMDNLNYAEKSHGSWWYRENGKVNLNGDYRVDYGSDDTSSMFWKHFPDGRAFPPLKKSVLMIR